MRIILMTMIPYVDIEPIKARFEFPNAWYLVTALCNVTQRQLARKATAKVPDKATRRCRRGRQ